MNAMGWKETTEARRWQWVIMPEGGICRICGKAARRLYGYRCKRCKNWAERVRHESREWKADIHSTRAS